MKLIEPWMPAHFQETEDAGILYEAKETEEKLEEMHIKKLNTEEQDFSGLCFSKILFENCIFMSCQFKRCEFTDVIFQSCNFSNSVIKDAYFNRCRIVSSKGMGANFSGSSIQNLEIQMSSMNYTVFDDCKMEKIRVEETEMRNASIAGCRLKQTEWNRVQLDQTSFFKTSLYGADFTTCRINGLVLSDDYSELKGLTVDLYQAADLARRMGIIISEE